jgi:hypothetical protein
LYDTFDDVAEKMLRSRRLIHDQHVRGSADPSPASTPRRAFLGSSYLALTFGRKLLQDHTETDDSRTHVGLRVAQAPNSCPTRK